MADTATLVTVDVVTAVALVPVAAITVIPQAIWYGGDIVCNWLYYGLGDIDNMLANRGWGVEPTPPPEPPSPKALFSGCTRKDHRQ